MLHYRFIAQAAGSQEACPPANPQVVQSQVEPDLVARIREEQVAGSQEDQAAGILEVLDQMSAVHHSPPYLAAVSQADLLALEVRVCSVARV